MTYNIILILPNNNNLLLQNDIPNGSEIIEVKEEDEDVQITDSTFLEQKKENCKIL